MGIAGMLVAVDTEVLALALDRIISVVAILYILNAATAAALTILRG
jgi:hypothetical protein